MILEDCYFYVNSEQAEEEQVIDILCLKCHEKHPDLGWFWQGSKHGYGPFEFKCSKCKYVIFSPDKNQKESTNEPEASI